MVKAYPGKESIGHFLKLFSGSMIAQGLTLVLTPLYAQLFTPAEFGLTAMYFAIFSIISVIGTARYEQAIMLPTGDHDARLLFWLVQLISAAFAVIVFLVVLFAGGYIASLSGNYDLWPWLWFLPLSLLLHGISQGCIFYANRNKQFGYMVENTQAQYATLNGSRLLTGILQSPFNGLLASQILAHAMSAIHIVWRTQKKLCSTANVSFDAIIKQAKKYSGYPRYNMLLNITNNLSGALPIFLFTRGFSAEVAGLFAFGYAFIFRPLSLFSQSLLQVLSQRIIEDYNQNKPVYPLLKNLVVKKFYLGIVPFVLLAIFAPTLFALVFPPEYVQAGEFVQILSPWLFMVYLTSPLAFLPELYSRQRKAMFIDLAYLVLRFLALSIGILAKNLFLSLGLFAAVSFAVVLFNLFWYLSLARNNEKGTGDGIIENIRT
ncbi:MAG TPA: oligosaccharide flippase family protein [Bacteroidales bacterium]|nr:oligosaccharide flippase family protein [Bacteroidales bacterium]